jgi:predicted acyltransferase
LKQRYYSLDVFRGATVALMILVNNPGSWAHIYSPLEHAPWHGATPTDLVFPFFLFAVGNALAFVLPRLEAEGDAAFWTKVIRRTLLIFAIGVFLTWFPFVQYLDDRLVFKGWEWVGDDGVVHGIRVMGVLQRIALCYFFASVIIYYLKPRGAFLAGLILLLLYWMLCVVGNPADPYSLTGWFGTKIDLAAFGEPHIYHGELLHGKPYAFDPEGLMSTLPAIVEVIFGFLVGDYIRKRGEQVLHMENPAAKGLAIYQTLTVLFVAAVALLFTGYAWNLNFPINKKIWTSSYVVFTSGLAILTLATLVYAIEVRQVRGWWTRFFNVFGKNPLFIFAFSSFLPKVLWLIRWPDHVDAKGSTVYMDPWHWWYSKVCARMPGAPEIGSLAFALSIIILFWAICYWMDKRKIYVKV